MRLSRCSARSGAPLRPGAGVGEEAFFRGFLMPFADGQLARLGAPEELASAGVLISTSVFFGALHAITPARGRGGGGGGQTSLLHSLSTRSFVHLCVFL